MRRRYAVLAAAALAGLLATWLLAPNLLVGLRSPRALAWTAAVGAGCLAVGLVARLLRAPGWLALTAAVLPGAVAVGLVVVRPIVAPRSLTEALPSALPSGSPSASPSASPRPTAAVPTEPAASPSTRPSASARPTAALPTRPAPSTPPPGPERLATGTLRGLAGHSAEGRVSTYRLADGSYVVRFEDVDIGGTPDPEVYVLPGRDRTGKRGGTHLGALKAERGSFHYALPAAFRDGDFTVLVWCERFAVDIAHATQNRD